MHDTFGLGLITYNNLNRFRECISNIPDMSGRPFVVINDGDPYDLSEYRPDMTVVQHISNKKIAKSKNDAIKYLLGHDVEWIFIMENDMIILDPGIFQHYIDVAKASGLLHMNYALHGDDNWHGGVPNPRLTYNSGLALYRYAGGCFQLFHRTVFETIGLFDEYYINCWEHLDFTFRATLAGLHTPFWLAADTSFSNKYIKQSDIYKESTTSTFDVNPHYWDGLYYWKFKYGEWFGNMKDWINPEHHTDIVIEMFKSKKYNDLKRIFTEFYSNNDGFFFNPNIGEIHIVDDTWAKIEDGSVTFFSK